MVMRNYKQEALEAAKCIALTVAGIVIMSFFMVLCS